MADSDGRGDRHVLVTGASSGIGEACARRLDRMGFHVFAGVRREADGEALRARCSDRLVPVLLDVTGEASIAAAAARVAAIVADDGLAGLVNNAGISIASPLEFVPIADLRRQLEVNVTGQIAVTQACLPLLRRARGRIVNIGSIRGKLATPLVGAYAVSKFAMEALNDALRIELQPWGIEVVLVEPGSVATPIWDKGLAQADELERSLLPEARQLYAGAIAAVRKTARETAARGIPPDAVAKVVARALVTGRPKTRYVVGRDAKVQALLAMLVPDRLRDRLLTRFLGLPGRG